MNTLFIFPELFSLPFFFGKLVQDPSHNPHAQAPVLPDPVASAQSHVHWAFMVPETFPPTFFPKSRACLSLTPWFALWGLGFSPLPVREELQTFLGRCWEAVSLRSSPHSLLYVVKSPLIP